MAFTVLIVDDLPDMRSFIKRVLDLSGFETDVLLEANNGKEALDVLSKEWVDVILTDTHMPVMNGPEFIRELVAHEAFRFIPVIVVSTGQTEDRVREMIGLGAKSCVKKPFHPEELRTEMENVLGAAA